MVFFKPLRGCAAITAAWGLIFKDYGKFKE